MASVGCSPNRQRDPHKPEVLLEQRIVLAFHNAPAPTDDFS